MKINYLILFSTLLALFNSPLLAEESWRDQAKSQQITDLETLCEPSPYSKVATTIHLPRWDGFTVKKHSDLKWTQDPSQYLTVYAIYPSKSLAADWVGNAVLDAKGKYDHNFAMKFAGWIKSQTNFRIPVGGFVDEKQGTYVFRDGIAVLIDPTIIPRERDGSIQIKTSAEGMKITTAMTAAALSSDTSLLRGSGSLARVATTTPKEYDKNDPPTKPGWDPGGWDPDALRGILIESLNGNRCELVRKFLVANPKGKR